MAEQAPDGGDLRLVVRGPDFNRPDVLAETTLILPLGAPAGSGDERLQREDLPVILDGDRVTLEEPFRPGPSGSVPGQKLGGFDFYGDQPVEIVAIQVENERLPKEVFYLPALLLLGLVVVLQRRRTDVPAF